MNVMKAEIAQSHEELIVKVNFTLITVCLQSDTLGISAPTFESPQETKFCSRY